MEPTNARPLRKPQRGAAMLELAIILPVLLMLAVPVFFILWHLIAQTIVTNTAREAANLLGRSVGYAGKQTMQTKMDRLALNAPPLQMAAHGNMLLTVIMPESGCMGSGCSGVVTAKWRWNGGAGPAISRWGSCLGNNWDSIDGHCKTPSSDAIPLAYAYPGKPVYIAEVTYQLPAWAGLPFFHIPGLDQEPLYAQAIF
jgi:Flp pilus assembly protein TadG